MSDSPSPSAENPRSNPDGPNWVERSTLAVLTLTLIAASIAAFQAARLADLTREMEQSDERPWIAVSGIFHDRSARLIEGQPFDYLVEFANVGKTPARNVVWRLKSRFIPIYNHVLDLSRVRGTDVSDAPITSSDEVVFQTTGRDIYQPHLGYIPPAVIGSGPRITAAMLDGTSALIIEGRVTYRAGSERGITTFCYVMAPDAKSPLGLGSVNTMMCGTGNDSK